MRILIFILIFITSLVALDMNREDNRNYSLRLHTFDWNTNWNKRLIEYDELKSGGPARDGIPPIDNPKFISTQKAKSWLKDNEPLIFVQTDDESKAYPLQVLIWHEIVNDSLGSKDIAVTFCPLCNASIVFDRVLGDKVYDFGTSGLLRNSDLVMYDRQTDSLWQQFTGQSIVGEMTSQTLKQLPSSILSFKTIYENYPKTQILSKKTGHNRDYGRNPYVGYDDINQTPFMLDKPSDERLFPMQRVATVSLNEKDKAYTYEILREKRVVNDNFENKNLVLFYQNEVNSALDRPSIAQSRDVGTVVIYEAKFAGLELEFYYDNGFFDKQTHSQWNIFGEAISGKLKGKKLTPVISGAHFWFAWAVFKPNTLIYQ